MLILLFTLTFVSFSYGLVTSGTINSNQDWFVLEKFCFNTQGKGELVYEFDWEGNALDPNYKFLFYYDNTSEWGKIQADPESLTCSEKVDLARAYRTPVSGNTGDEFFEDDVQSHYWYFVLSNCAAGELSKIKYDLTIKNSAPSGETQFSCDWQGMSGIYISFFICSLLIFGIHLSFVIKLHRSASYHPIVKLLTTSLSLFIMGEFCVIIHLSIYSQNGIGAFGLYNFGQMLIVFSSFVLAWFIMLLAKGWTVSTSEIPDRKYLLIGLGSIQLAMLISLSVALANPSTMYFTYFWETPAGTAALIIRSILGIWVGIEFFKTYKAESDQLKIVFYQRFGFISVFYFFFLPLVVLIAISSPDISRIKVVSVFDLLFSVFLYSGLTWLFSPNRAGQYFKISPPDLIAGSTPYDTI